MLTGLRDDNPTTVLDGVKVPLITQHYQKSRSPHSYRYKRVDSLRFGIVPVGILRHGCSRFEACGLS